MPEEFINGIHGHFKEEGSCRAGLVIFYLTMSGTLPLGAIS